MDTLRLQKALEEIMRLDRPDGKFHQIAKEALAPIRREALPLMRALKKEEEHGLSLQPLLDTAQRHFDEELGHGQG